MLTVVHRYVRWCPKDFLGYQFWESGFLSCSAKSDVSDFARLKAEVGQGRLRVKAGHPVTPVNQGVTGSATFVGDDIEVTQLFPDTFLAQVGLARVVATRRTHWRQKTRRHWAAGSWLSCVQDQFGSVADFGFGGNAALVRVPRRRSNAMLSALSSLASGGT
jgi:hypothetical protein